MASTEPTLYAWARPVSFNEKLGDHTYVTDYKKPFEDEPPTRSWYCGGEVESLNSKGVRPLLEAKADIQFAEFICTPDDPRPCVAPQFESTAGIVYGLTGLCHQIANWILFAAQSSSDAPVLVDKARGYELYAYGVGPVLSGTRHMPRFGLMFFGYGDYGLNEPQWRDRLTRYGEE